MTTRESVVNKLQKLPSSLLSRVDEFLDFLIAQQQDQGVNVQSEDTLTDRWKQWFEAVDLLSVSTHQPQDN
ncbi:hypothetical protein [Anabaena azotica]|uniref:hypothetical protein n=1 Tax=Anabaena azotica TaxID=197653 RepID=UPI0039A67C74